MSDTELSDGRLSAGCENPDEIEISELGPRLRLGLAEFWRALEYSRAAKRDPWDFAVEIATLRAIGLTETDFRWLVCMGFVEHARETTKLEEDGRQFGRLTPTTRERPTCTAAIRFQLGTSSGTNCAWTASW